MEGVGGTGQMVLGALVSGLVCALIALVAARRFGAVPAVAWAGLLWSVTVIGLVTLMPLYGVDLAVPAETRSETCSFDYGGPAPDGFWIFAGTQRMLNTVLFVPAGAFLVLVLTTRRVGWLVVPFGLAGLAAYSVGIELVQLELARIDRACDVTDIVDNVTGAVLGVLLGVVLSLVLRPWRRD